MELSAGWPRAITVTEAVECRELEDSPAAAAGCEPLVATRQFLYADGRYRAGDGAPPSASRSGAEETQETTP